MVTGKTIRFFGRNVATDPLSFPDMLRRRLEEAVFSPPSGVATVNFGDVHYEIDLSMHKLARKYYFRTHEMFLERVFRRCLKDGSVFIDVGANCGYWSAYALSLVGKNGAVHAFEPVPVYFEYVHRLARNNPGYHVYANNAAVGRTNDKLEMNVVLPRKENFYNYYVNIGSSSLLPGFLEHDQHLTERIWVNVLSLDNYIEENGINLDAVGLIKIDVEGYESFVLDGMVRVLERNVPVLCEVLSDSARHALMDGADVMRRFERHGYICLDASTFKPMRPENMGFEENILCISASDYGDKLR